MENEKTTSKLAVTSLVLGLMGGCLWLFASVPAIITGLMARKRIAASDGRLGGDGIALGGVVVGGVMSVVGLAGFLVLMGFTKGVGAFKSLKQEIEEARIELLMLESAVTEFETEQRQLPKVSTNDFLTDEADGVWFLSVLAAEEVDGRQNRTEKNYLEEIEDRLARDGGGALKGFLDPWENPYRVILKDRKGPTFEFDWGGKRVSLYGKTIAIGSRGPDGVEGTGDDMVSWE
ncbi:MAG: DUF4190 domain-containing protein [Verrucomicrobiota bacterium]